MWKRADQCGFDQWLASKCQFSHLYYYKSFRKDSSLPGSLQQRLLHKRTVKNVALHHYPWHLLLHCKTTIFYSNNVGGKPQAARAIFWFWHLLMKMKSTQVSQQASQFCREAAEALQHTHSPLQLDNKKLSLGIWGLSDFLRGMSARFSQPVEVCELVTCLLTTCRAVL